MLPQISLAPPPTSRIHISPLIVFNNNNGEVFLSQDTPQTADQTTVTFVHHYIRELIQNQHILPHMINTKLMPTDFLTNNTPKEIQT